MLKPFDTTKFEARGLGMAVVCGILNALQGAMGIVSELGKGACIRAYGPI